MKLKGSSLPILVSAVVVRLIAGDPLQTAAPAPDVSARANRVRAMPVVSEHRYVIKAGVRFLPLSLAWITRDNVGTGSIVHRRDAEREAFELLMGSTPSRAFGVNRWGYLQEEQAADTGYAVTIMNAEDAESADEAKSQREQERQSNRYAFKVYGARLGPAAQTAQESRFVVSREFTLNELDALLPIATGELSRIRQEPLTVGPVHPGLISALMELIRRDAEARQAAAARKPPLPSLRYLYKRTPYELQLKSSDLLRTENIRSRAFANVVEAEFESRDLVHGKKSRFNVAYGTDPPFKEAILRLTYHARWWFRFELAIDATEAGSVARTSP